MIKDCGVWIGLGIGVALGSLGGMLLMNNCRRVRMKVADVQDTIAEKCEAKKRAILEKRYAKYGNDYDDDYADEHLEVIKTKGKK